MHVYVLTRYTFVITKMRKNMKIRKNNMFRDAFLIIIIQLYIFMVHLKQKQKPPNLYTFI